GVVVIKVTPSGDSITPVEDTRKNRNNRMIRLVVPVFALPVPSWISRSIWLATQLGLFDCPRRSGLNGPVDLGEQVGDRGTNGANRDHGRDGEEGQDEGVLDGLRAGVVGYEAVDLVLHIDPFTLVNRFDTEVPTAPMATTAATARRAKTRAYST